ncbi:MAG: hypothetical protein HN657_02990 [Candidatus Marinimicrobia bacterium]|jgi:Fe-S cluster assembly iron-binding protein IscA|nr:hypothetical protein [Candidatus Neomarinimicrobiota bacterium]MBT3691592.1 hypothetical protein [Candidatus Neomarinimicrobiota bacterium]MBT3731463.1 hypothetical protein [Candidatus Neomarinimicrobiota bacterium]MBT4144165.1 hypothetical protein [Candidatus Neomarinimicrobiota bacterium]MBT4178530.1 hypothetical protein [Candidatus Neomarinimicrobiota bacterium]
MALDESNNTDKKYSINGIEVIISEKDQNHVDSFMIDYVNDYRGKGLTIQSAGAC